MSFKDVQYGLLPLLLCAACGSSDDAAAPDDGDPAMEEPSPQKDPMDPMDSMEPTEDPMEPDPSAEAVNGTRPCPALESGFDGDELCILPPDPGTGMHMHVGPTDYDDPDQIAEFIVPPGAEPTDYYIFHAGNEEPIQFYKQHYRMRPGSHHLIIHVVGGDVGEARWLGERPSAAGYEGIQIGGTQRSNFDFPPGGVIPPEDADLARPVGVNQGMVFEWHYVNSTEKAILREGWVNFMNTESDSPSLLGGLFMIGWQFSVPPGARQVLSQITGPDELQAPMRIVSVFGHRHASTERFTAWVHRDGERTLIYEDYDWAEPAELVYNSVIDNGTPDPGTFTPGGFSGILEINPGDQLEWECEVLNTGTEALTFGNEVYTKEMCNVFGSMAGGTSPIWFSRPSTTSIDM